MSDTFAIQANGLCKTYSEGMIFRKRLNALKDVSFEVNKGEAFGLLGPNGAGKTTFIKILLGVIRKTTGNASLLGFPAGSRQGRQLVGYLPEHLRVPAHMTGFTALECFGNLANIPTRVIKEKREDLLAMVGLAGRGNDRVKKYSKGMVQRLGLAQALLGDPKLLILDEPTDGLDPRARAEVRQVIRGLTEKGVTIFLNSHLLGEVETTCDRVAILNRGELKYFGGVDEIGDVIGGSKGHIKVILGVKGNPDVINSCFDGSEFKILERKTETEFRVETSVGNQEAVDKLVDTLREKSVSIIELERKQISLEDAFLHIVEDPKSQQNLQAYLKN